MSWPDPTTGPPAAGDLQAWAATDTAYATDGCGHGEWEGLCPHGYPTWPLYLGEEGVKAILAADAEDDDEEAEEEDGCEPWCAYEHAAGEDCTHSMWCPGVDDHNAADDCVNKDPCDPRCLGHWGKQECTPCDEDHCVSHDTDTGEHELCDGGLHCYMHEWDPDNEELAQTLGHAAWCTDNESWRRIELPTGEIINCWPNDECTREMLYFTIKTNVNTCATEIESRWSSKDPVKTDDMDAITGELAKGKVMLAELAKCQAMMAQELEALAEFQKTGQRP